MLRGGCLSVNRVKEQVIGRLQEVLLLVRPALLGGVSSADGFLCRSMLWFDFIIIADLEDASADRRLSAHDDALSHALDLILLALDGRVVEVLRCHLERGKHEDRLLHLLDAESRDAKHLSLEGHLVSQQLDVPLVDLDTVLADSELYLLDDLAASCLDTQNLSSFHDVVRRGGSVVNTRDAHDLGQAVALDSQVVSIIGVLFFGNNCALNTRHALDDHMGQASLQLLHYEVKAVATCLIWLNMHFVVAHYFDVAVFDLELGCFEDALPDGLDGDLELQSFNRGQVDLDRQVAPCGRIHLLDVLSDVAQFSLLDPTLDDASSNQRLLVLQARSDDGRRDLVCSVDDLLDPRHTKSDVHGCHTGEMERLERHLRGRLTNRLSGYGTASLTRLDLSTIVSHPDQLNKLVKLVARQVVEVLQEAPGAVFSDIEEQLIDLRGDSIEELGQPLAEL